MIRNYDVVFFAASINDAEMNRRFAESLKLDYAILSDPGKQVARAYGVLKGKRRHAARHTIYIGVDGKVLYIDKKVKPWTAGVDMVRRLEALGFRQRKKGSRGEPSIRRSGTQG